MNFYEWNICNIKKMNDFNYKKCALLFCGKKQNNTARKERWTKYAHSSILYFVNSTKLGSQILVVLLSDILNVLNVFKLLYFFS